MKTILSISLVTLAATLGGEGLCGAANPETTSTLEFVVSVPPRQVVNSMLLSPNGKALATLRGVHTSWNEGGAGAHFGGMVLATG